VVIVRSVGLVMIASVGSICGPYRRA